VKCQPKHIATRMPGPHGWTVDLDHAANVMVMDSSNWQRFRNGGRARYVDGGYFTRTPARVLAPRAGTWWVVVQSPTGGAVGYTIR
jgi:hypothetical protein